MERPMARSSVCRLVCLGALALGISAPAAKAGIPERLKWVRGTAVCVTGDMLTTQFRDRTLLVKIDDTTQVIRVGSAGTTLEGTGLAAAARLRTGEAIEVHYRDAKGSRTARYVWVGVPLDAKSVSKHPGTSAAGSVTEMKGANWLLPQRVTLASGKDHRRFLVPSNAQVSDALQPNDRVVAVYRRSRSQLTAQVLRKVPVRQALRPGAIPEERELGVLCYSALSARDRRSVP